MQEDLKGATLCGRSNRIEKACRRTTPSTDHTGFMSIGMDGSRSYDKGLSFDAATTSATQKYSDTANSLVEQR